MTHVPSSCPPYNDFLTLYVTVVTSGDWCVSYRHNGCLFASVSDASLHWLFHDSGCCPLPLKLTRLVHIVLLLKVPLCVGFWCWNHWQRGVIWPLGLQPTACHTSAKVCTLVSDSEITDKVVTFDKLRVKTCCYNKMMKQRESGSLFISQLYFIILPLLLNFQILSLIVWLAYLLSSVIKKSFINNGCFFKLFSTGPHTLFLSFFFKLLLTK